jgi:hypothetical protein
MPEMSGCVWKWVIQVEFEIKEEVAVSLFAAGWRKLAGYWE